MKCTIIYWSRYGNGKKVVDKLASNLQKNGAEVQVHKTDEADPKAMPEADFYVFSAPTEAFRVQVNMKKFMKGLQGMEGKKYGIINTHGMKRNWLKSMEKLLSKKNMVKVAEVDFQMGKEVNDSNGLLEGWEAKLDSFAASLRA